MFSKAFLATALNAVLASASYNRFFAESGGLRLSDYVDELPTEFNISNGNYLSGIALDSYWSSSYITGTNDKEYLVLSHFIAINPVMGFHRASVLDITDPSYYNTYTTLDLNITDQYTQNAQDFNWTLADFYMGAAYPGSELSTLRTWSTNPAAQFDFTYELSTPIILNAGVGTFAFGNGTASEFSMPSGRTTGSLVVNAENISVDPERSFTWYDRQWQPVNPTNWTWFQLHLYSGPGKTSTKMSIWFWDDPTQGHKQFATVRSKPGISEIVPIESLTAFGDTWTSTNTGFTYDLNWNLILKDGTELSISSVRPDQELWENTQLAIAYEGFVEVNGTYKNGRSIDGYGLVEIIPALG